MPTAANQAASNNTLRRPTTNWECAIKVEVFPQSSQCYIKTLAQNNFRRTATESSNIRADRRSQAILRQTEHDSRKMAAPLSPVACVEALLANNGEMTTTNQVNKAMGRYTRARCF